MLDRRGISRLLAPAGAGLAVSSLLLLAAAPSVSAGGKLGFVDGKAGQGRVCYFGECADDVGPFSGEALSAFDPPPAISEANYANEATDFGVPPRRELQADFGLPTPVSIPGARVVTTAELVAAQNRRLDFLLLDVWDAPGHPSIQGSRNLAYAGRAGSFDDETEAQLWTDLGSLTKGQPDYPIVFFSRSSRGWDAYNAALRAVRLGFSNVYWFRGGLDAWEAARLPEGEIAAQ